MLKAEIAFALYSDELEEMNSNDMIRAINEIKDQYGIPKLGHYRIFGSDTLRIAISNEMFQEGLRRDMWEGPKINEIKSEAEEEKA